jgi:hypothetical protein
MRINGFRLAMAAAVLAMAAVGIANAQSCTSSITKCGCTITTTGVYTVDADLDYTQGLTSRKGCIDISAANVKLFTNGHFILGDETGTNGIGIHLLSTADGAFLESAGTDGTNFSYTDLVGWQYGLESQADNVYVDGFGTDGNSTGVFLKGTSRNTISFAEAAGNSVYGIWIDAGSNNAIAVGNLQYSGVAGVYIGCSATGPTGKACSRGSASYNNIVTGTFSGPPTNYGVAVEQNSTGNIVADNYTLGNTNYDLFDGNSTAVNTWHSNAFATVNKSYIH